MYGTRPNGTKCEIHGPGGQSILNPPIKCLKVACLADWKHRPESRANGAVVRSNPCQPSTGLALRAAVWRRMVKYNVGANCKTTAQPWFKNTKDLVSCPPIMICSKVGPWI
ncbi:hypothetical protein BDDG_06078 [Blastomyces dermatitidis ATCC 18188]|uniref:Uncharacterized protein n=1 Tax=Ajellomyces dermatitidis (strain ATCC 18188 / CBS 674.68) TaxID=653446 RepID=F2TIS1_AJEDA|nr:hypothetical protein BDDG_06078 [Blastomyces dermatitidis ATCC 18188]